MTTRLEVVPGPGWVLRYGQICVWAGPQASSALLSFLALSARNLASSSRGGELLAAHVAGVLAASDPEPEAPFATLGPGGSGALVVLLHGPVRLWDGTRWAEPPLDPGWSRLELPEAAVLIAGAAGAQPVPGGSHPLLDLEAGTVPGAGFARIAAGTATGGSGPIQDPGLTPEGPGTPPAPDPPVVAPVAAATPAAAMPAPPAPTPPMADETIVLQTAADPTRMSTGTDPGVLPTPGPPTGGRLDDAPTSVLPLGGNEPTAVMRAPGATHPPPLPTAPAAPRPPGVIGLLPPPGGPVPPAPVGPVGAVPIVRGLRCSRGHFNHSGAPACLRCGEALDPQAGPVSGPRPPLGVLVVDDGTVVALDRTYLLGSGVSADPAVTGGTARALPLEGARVADVHAEIRLADWTARLVDRGAPGGTHLLAPGEEGWSALARFQEVTLPPGSHVAVGTRVLTFVSPWPAERPYWTSDWYCGQ